MKLSELKELNFIFKEKHTYIHTHRHLTYQIKAIKSESVQTYYEILCTTIATLKHPLTTLMYRNSYIKKLPLTHSPTPTYI